MGEVLFSVLDLSPIVEGATAGEALANTLDLARHVEGLGYTRYWLAEHHNIPGVASAATAVVIGHVAGGTRRIRVGAGGIMLPNHAPLVIAEQFGTLESLYPGRIDLGLGRAPGGDMETARALRRYLGSSGDQFPEELAELQGYFRGGGRVRAIPGEGLKVPLYLLGSSDFSARLAGAEGLPFAFASHFAPDYLGVALRLYRDGFRPSEQLAKPHVIVGVNVFAAATDGEARREFTTVQQMFLGMLRGTRGKVVPPVETMEGRWSAAEAAQVGRMTKYALVGSAETILGQVRALLEETGAEELMLTSHAYDHGARKRTFAVMGQVMGVVNAERGVGMG